MAACVALCSCTGRTTAGRSPSTLPSVGEVQEHFIKALGGEAAINRPRSATLRAENVLYGPNGKTIRYTGTLYLGDFKRLEIDTVPGRGRFYSGTRGAVGGSLDDGNDRDLRAPGLASSGACLPNDPYRVGRERGELGDCRRGVDRRGLARLVVAASALSRRKRTMRSIRSSGNGCSNGNWTEPFALL